MKAGSWEIVAAVAWIRAVDHAAVARTLLAVPSCSPPSATTSQRRQPVTGPLMPWEIDTAVEDGSALAVDAAVVEGSRRRSCRAPAGLRAAITVGVAVIQICRHHAAGG
ncbi:hypothetical protein ACLOJK_018271 [Asimina triloba]